MMLRRAALGGAPAVYIEDVFSTYLYNGTGSTQTITNGIDLAGKGGLVWIKRRNEVGNNFLADTVRGRASGLYSNTTGAATTSSAGADLSAFNNNGFSLGTAEQIQLNTAFDYASWTFREQAKFYTQKQISHTNGTATNIDLSSLGTVGYAHAKITNTTGDWIVWHRSLTAGNNLRLNTTAAQTTTNAWLSVSGTTATLSSSAPTGTYVIHAFAHDAGGFGLSGTDNVISCGSFTAAPNTNVTLGWEPQWLLMRPAADIANWRVIDTMRGDSLTGQQFLYANTSGAEVATSDWAYPTATGFNTGSSTQSGTWIYIAIRRGPMKVPTDGTKVFKAIARTGTGAAATVTGVGFTPDLLIGKRRTLSAGNFWDRLRGPGILLDPTTTSSEATDTTAVSGFDLVDGVKFGSDTSNGYINGTSSSYINWFFRRAPGVHEQICYSGTGANKTETHGLQKAPELWAVKSRSGATEWVFGSSLLSATEKIVMPSPNGRVTDATVWNSTLPTSTALSLGTSSTVNASGATFTAYMWATTAGVSKVGTYTGNGTSQTINCGFTGGARFVMILRATASTAQDIYIWDSARGIVAGNDPRLSINKNSAEVTTDDSLDTDSTGFIVNQDAATNVNVNGAVYLYLAYA